MGTEDMQQNIGSFKNCKVTIPEELVYQELDGEMVLLNMQSGQYFGIDEIGSKIWALLEEKVMPVDIVQRLVAEYEVSEKVCQQQVAAFLDELEKEGLIKI